MVQSIPKDTVKENKRQYIFFLHVFTIGFVTGVRLQSKQAPSSNQSQTVQSTEVLFVLINKLCP